MSYADAEGIIASLTSSNDRLAYENDRLRDELNELHLRWTDQCRTIEAARHGLDELLRRVGGAVV